MKILVQIFEDVPGIIEAKSLFPNEQTANILMSMAVKYFNKAAIEAHELRKQKQGRIINPHTGEVMVRAESNVRNDYSKKVQKSKKDIEKLLKNKKPIV